MIIKTSELEGAALDWAVAKAIGENNHIESRFFDNAEGRAEIYRWCAREYSQDWVYGGPLIEQHGLCVGIDDTSIENPSYWAFKGIDGCESAGSTILVAAMRAIVAAELGETVDVPEELVG